MIKLDESKRYKLDNASKEQIQEVLEYLQTTNTAWSTTLTNRGELVFENGYWHRDEKNIYDLCITTLFEPKLKIGDTFEYNGFICEVKENIEKNVWFLLKNKHTKSITYRYAKENEFDCFNNDEDVECIKITNKEFIKQLEENAQ